MPLTTNKDDPRLKDTSEKGQQEVYLVLSDEEKDKGYVRPVRQNYIHVGDVKGICGKPFGDKGTHLCSLDPGHEGDCYIGINKKNITEKDGKYYMGDKGCGALTKMILSIAETYARNPKFYGATFCVECNRHFSVLGFQWEDGTVVGS